MDNTIATKPVIEKKEIPKVLKPQQTVIDKTPSLKDTLTRINNIGTKKTDSENTEIVEEQLISQIQKQLKIEDSKLNQTLQVFIENLKADYPRLYSAMKIYPAVCSDEGLITLTFQNNAIIDDFKLRIKPSLISFLRSKFNSEQIEVAEKIVQTEEMEKPTIYSDQEKLQHMISQNPSLQKLKSLFNLDFDR